MAFVKLGRNVPGPTRTGLFVALRSLLFARSKKVLLFVVYDDVGDDDDDDGPARPRVDDDNRFRELRNLGLPPLNSASFVEFVRRKSAVCQLLSSEHCRLRALVNRHIRTLPSLMMMHTYTNKMIHDDR